MTLPLEASDEDLRQLAKTLDGFLFTGGPDPHPFLFGEETHQKCGLSSQKRDSLETRLLPLVMAEKKPILGICRGIQIINVALGGTIYQDIPSQFTKAGVFPLAHKQPSPYAQPSHHVHMVPGSMLAKIFGAETLLVNSMHHQALKDMAPGFTACGFASDGLIEAAEMPSYPFLAAVQWHPEHLWPQAGHGPAVSGLCRSGCPLTQNSFLPLRANFFFLKNGSFAAAASARLRFCL